MSIEFSGSLKNKRLEKQIIDLVISEINANFHDVTAMKLDIELINEIANLIEDTVKCNKIKKIDKLALFMKIHYSVFGITSEAEKSVIKNNIEYLHSNNKIKARSLMKKVLGFVKNVMVKK